MYTRPDFSNICNIGLLCQVLPAGCGDWLKDRPVICAMRDAHTNKLICETGLGCVNIDISILSVLECFYLFCFKNTEGR